MFLTNGEGAIELDHVLDHIQLSVFQIFWYPTGIWARTKPKTNFSQAVH